jgi:hypothetical protein
MSKSHKRNKMVKKKILLQNLPIMRTIILSQLQITLEEGDVDVLALREDSGFLFGVGSLFHSEQFSVSVDLFIVDSLKPRDISMFKTIE